MLVHRDVVADFLPHGGWPVTPWNCADPMSYLISNGQPTAAPPNLKPAGPEDFDQEWLKLTLGVKVVGGLDEAIDHIAAHSTAHSDGIPTESRSNAAVNEVDSAAVFCQCQHPLQRRRPAAWAQKWLSARKGCTPADRWVCGTDDTYKWVVFGEGQACVKPTEFAAYPICGTRTHHCPGRWPGHRQLHIHKTR